MYASQIIYGTPKNPYYQEPELEIELRSYFPSDSQYPQNSFYWEDIQAKFTVRVKVYDVSDNSMEASKEVRGALAVLEDIADAIVEAFQAFVEFAIQLIQAAVDWIWEVIKNLIKALFEPINNFFRNWAKTVNDMLLKYLLAEQTEPGSGNVDAIMNAITGGA
jgi:hypothetical protein